MDNEAPNSPTYRIIEDPAPSLRNAEDRGSTLWLVLDPMCHEQALAQLYEHEHDADISVLFFKTPLANLLDISPRVTAIGLQSRMLRWLFDKNPENWGMVLASDATQDEILNHLRSLIMVKTDEKDVIFRVWDGSVLNRFCSALPDEIPALLGPVRRVVARTHAEEWACIDRDGEEFMKTPHKPRQPLPCPWYRITERHERAWHDQRPAILTSNIMEALLHERTTSLPLHPTERLHPFVARHVDRGMELGLWRAEALELFVHCCLQFGESFPEAQPMPAAFSRRPIDEDMAILAMRRICNQGGCRD